MKEKIKELKTITSKINSLTDFVAESGSRYIYICRNNGQFHKGDRGTLPGYATYLGRMTVEEAEVFYKSLFGYTS